MKNRIVLLLIVFLLVLILLNGGMSISYYESTQENSRVELENVLKQPNAPVILQASIKRALLLENKDLDKLAKLTKRSNIIVKNVRTSVTIVKLAVAGDLLKFINSIDNIDKVDEKTLLAKATASLAPDIKAYRLIIELLLSEPNIPPEILNGLKSIQKFNDEQLIVFGHVIEDGLVSPDDLLILVTNPDKLRKGLDDIRKSPKMPINTYIKRDRRIPIIKYIIQTSKPTVSPGIAKDVSSAIEKVVSSSSSM